MNKFKQIKNNRFGGKKFPQFPYTVFPTNGEIICTTRTTNWKT